MSFENEFLELMPHTVILTAPTGYNAQGKPTYVGGTAVSYRGRVVGTIQALRDSKRAQESPMFMIYIAAGNGVITTEYKLDLPSDAVFGTRAPFIFAIERLTDENSNHHVKLICGYTFHHQAAL